MADSQSHVYNQGLQAGTHHDRHTGEIYRRQPKTRTRSIKDEEFHRAQCAVMQYAVTLKSIRIRYGLFRKDTRAVAIALGSQKLQSATTAENPGCALLKFLQGTYNLQRGFRTFSGKFNTSKPAQTIKVLSHGKMQYIHGGRTSNAEKSFLYSSKHKSLYISGGGGKWRLDLVSSTDDKLFWNNLDFKSDRETDRERELIVYSRIYELK